MKAQKTADIASLTFLCVQQMEGVRHEEIHPFAMRLYRNVLNRNPWLAWEIALQFSLGEKRRLHVEKVLRAKGLLNGNHAHDKQAQSFHLKRVNDRLSCADQPPVVLWLHSEQPATPHLLDWPASLLLQQPHMCN